LPGRDQKRDCIYEAEQSENDESGQPIGVSSREKLFEDIFVIHLEKFQGEEWSRRKPGDINEARRVRERERANQSNPNNASSPRTFRRMGLKGLTTPTFRKSRTFNAQR